jgi:hypothetical protein
MFKFILICGLIAFAIAADTTVPCVTLAAATEEDVKAKLLNIAPNFEWMAGTDGKFSVNYCKTSAAAGVAASVWTAGAAETNYIWLAIGVSKVDEASVGQLIMVGANACVLQIE